MTADGILLGSEPLDVAKPDEADLRMWSVTTIIGCLDKPALVYWAANEAAHAAVAHHDTWRSIEESSGSAEAERWISSARFRSPKGERKPAELGTAIHAAAEEYAITGKRPELADDPEIRPYFEQWDRWLQTFQPQYIAAEMTVFSPSIGVAGTCDGIFVVDGVRTIFDLKTTKKAYDKKGNPAQVYPEVALQLAACRHAELAAVWRPRRFESFKRRYYLLGKSEREQGIAVPEVDTGLAIKITTEHCIARPVRCDAEVYEAFLAVLDSAKWAFETSKGVIGEPLTAPGQQVAA